MSNHSFYYQCMRCELKKNKKIDIQRHMDRQKKCIPKNEEILSMSEEEIRSKSLEKKYNPISVIESDQENELMCKFCQKTFKYKYYLSIHDQKCKMKYHTTPSTITNIENQYITQNIVNHNSVNINISVDKKDLQDVLIPFYDKFDISHISHEKKMELIIKTAYKDTMEEILKNDANLNYYLVNSKEGYIYEDKIKNFIKMNSKEIHKNICKKLQKSLSDIIHEYKEKEYIRNEQMFRNYLHLVNESYVQYIDNNKDFVVPMTKIIDQSFEINKDRFTCVFEELKDKTALIDA